MQINEEYQDGAAEVMGHILAANEGAWTAPRWDIGVLSKGGID